MRISDWSSDVCSSDLTDVPGMAGYDTESHTLTFVPDNPIPPNSRVTVTVSARGCYNSTYGRHLQEGDLVFWFETRRETKRLLLHSPASTQRAVLGCDLTIETSAPFRALLHAVRSEERRVGKECGSTCRS